MHALHGSQVGARQYRRREQTIPRHMDSATRARLQSGAQSELVHRLHISHLQIRKLAARIDQWSKDVLEASKVVEKNASDIIIKHG